MEPAAIQTHKRHTEQTLESAIVDTLTSQQAGYSFVHGEHFRKDIALYPEGVLGFLQATQPKEWDKITGIHKERVEDKVMNRLVKELEMRGSLDVLRKGFTDMGVKFRMAYFRPETSLNATAQQQYDANILTVMRQIHFALKNEKSLDLVLLINGVPVATAELKNQFTGQNVNHAKAQYKYDRDYNEPIFRFKQRALVHFVVDTDEVFITTRLNGDKTRYLPFNKGNQQGAGNPVNEHGYRTSYLWEHIWTKDSWLDIIGKYLHLQVTEEDVLGKKVKKESLIFPRYHQLDAVRELTRDARSVGAGKNYLVQHSAGSGKSNTIAWLAYRLANLHNERDQRIFHSVIVVTDRKVLDSQLQETIYQFEHKLGVVQKIDKSSEQLAGAIKKGTNIIITTLQKFPFVIDKVGMLPDRAYAVIVDEAHSSQSGTAHKKMKEVLTASTLESAEKEESDEDDENYEDVLRKIMQAHGRKSNLSFFAFTATPKEKTLAVFGVPDETGKMGPAHLYSMRQAIEENFILDVLEHYTTYKAYYRLNKKMADDPKISKKRGAAAVARYMSLHPHNLAQKTEVMIEHFQRVTSKKIGGMGKAMLVTSSRLHAVRYKDEFDRYIKEHGYTDMKTLVAFSGKVEDPQDVFVTEPQLNGFGERELPEQFRAREYGVLIVAEKYQTGFDQPLLHTMYVDKKLDGVKAVQTLSRLNRTHPGKEDTFILDFQNEAEDIQAAFQNYYVRTILDEMPEPNHLYDLKSKLEQARIIWPNEVEQFSSVFYSPYFIARDQGELNGFIDPAVDRYEHLPSTKAGDDTSGAPSTKEDFKHTLQVFLRFYNLITQLVSFGDIELEKFYTYCRFLEKKLPVQNLTEQFRLSGDEVVLQYYRLQRLKHDESISLVNDDAFLPGITTPGIRSGQDEKVQLSEIIHAVNTRFGTEFNDADRYLIEAIIEDCVADQTLADQARSNTIENFQYGFNDVVLGKWIDRMGLNEVFFKNLMDNEKLSAMVNQYVMKQVYERLKAGATP